MTTARVFSSGAIATILFGVALFLAAPRKSVSADEPDFAALQADARKTFQDQVTPFVKNYCFKCHGDRKMKGGINFAPGLKSPGDSAARIRWKQALANVKAH